MLNYLKALELVSYQNCYHVITRFPPEALLGTINRQKGLYLLNSCDRPHQKVHPEEPTTR